jgi:tetratricopeptide (TPR) repeat protein
MMRRTGIRSRLSVAVVGALAILVLAGPVAPQEAQPSAPKQNEQPTPVPSKPVDSPSAPPSDQFHSPLGEAIALARKGDCDAAIKKYQQVLQEKPKSPDAYAGLTRCYLKDNDVAKAYETITKGSQVADGPPVQVALGEVYFRQGKIGEAEKEWVGVINSGGLAARAYLGVARVRWAIEMNKSAKAMIDKAHELDPGDPDIQRAWIGTLRRSERIKYYEEYLAEPNDSHSDQRGNLQGYLTYLKERANRHDPPCRLVSKVKNTETPLVRLLSDPQHLRGYGLPVDLNGTRANIMLDTGASGIVVKRHIAEKAGIVKLTETKIGGVGDKGLKNAYVGTAKSIRIGQLEFQDCPVEVMEGRSVADEDGLVGADVFEDFLVEIDFPNEELKLSELPKRPGQSDPQLALKNEDDADDQETSEKAEATPPAADKEMATAANSSGPQDRYVAPEMQSFTRIFRFGHDLLIPTKIGDAPSKLFLLDTGALTNSISPAAAREVTKVHGDSDMFVKGISGSVKNVYSANKAVIQFGRLRQENQDMLSFDTTSLSDHSGTEISGFLGFTTLRFLDIKIDYRDALVDFSYDAKRFGR